MTAFITFVVVAITMIILFFSLAAGIALAEEQVISSIKARTEDIKRWGGYILIGVGIWFISLTVFVDFFVSIFSV